MDTSMQVPPKTKNRIPYGSAILLLGIYPNDALIYNKDSYSIMVTTDLFLITRSCKKPRCYLTEEWIQKMWSTHTMEYYLATKYNDFKVLGKEHCQ